MYHSKNFTLDEIEAIKKMSASIFLEHINLCPCDTAIDRLITRKATVAQVFKKLEWADFTWLMTHSAVDHQVLALAYHFHDESTSLDSSGEIEKYVMTVLKMFIPFEYLLDCMVDECVLDSEEIAQLALIKKKRSTSKRSQRRAQNKNSRGKLRRRNKVSRNKAK